MPSRSQVNQSQSPFFGKLPLELRNEVYSYVFCGSLHMMNLLPGLRAIRCFTDPRTDVASVHNCWVYPDTAVRVSPQHILQLHRVQKRGNGRLLSIVLTCWQAHDEAIRLLYQVPVFDFLNPKTVERIPRVMPKSRLQELRSLRLVFSCPLDGGSYPMLTQRGCWTILSRLEGLLELHVTLDPDDPWQDRNRCSREHESAILAPMRCIRPKREYVVTLNWYTSERDLEELEEGPFKLVRGVEAHHFVL